MRGGDGLLEINHDTSLVKLHLVGRLPAVGVRLLLHGSNPVRRFDLIADLVLVGDIVDMGISGVRRSVLPEHEQRHLTTSRFS